MRKFQRVFLSIILALGLIQATMFIQPQNTYAIVGTATLANTIELNQRAINALTAQDPSTFASTDPLFIPVAYLESIKTKAQEIVATATTDYEKVKLIHDWMTNNIYYNYDGLLSGDYGDNSPYAVFVSKIAVCQGYAELTEAMLRSIGIPSILLVGKAIHSSSGETWDLEPEADISNHAFNAVFVDERWILVDTTWDTGNRYQNGMFIKGSTSYEYFDPTIELFSISHRILRMYEVEYQVTFDSQGGSARWNNALYSYGGKLWEVYFLSIYNSKAGYIFGGWYKEPECINKWSFADDRVYGDTTLYAKWVSLAEPTNVVIVSDTYNSITLNWFAISEATGYQVYRSTSSSGSYSWIANTSLTSYTNTGLITNTTYYYKVKAYNSVGTSTVFSEFSTIVSAKPTLSPPIGLSATILSTGNQLTWKAVSGADGYQIFRSTSSTGTFTWIANSSTTRYADTGVPVNTIFYYKVKSYKSVGATTVYSDSSTLVGVVPNPIGVSAVSNSYNSNKISWTGISGADGYQIYRSASSAGVYTWIGNAFTTSYINEGLTTNTTYYYKIKAYKKIGTLSVFSNYSVVTFAKPIPAAPQSVVAISASYNSIKISWAAVSGSDGYQVYRSNSATGTYTWLANAWTNSYINLGLSTGTTYYYKVKAYKMVGTTSVFGNDSKIISAKPIPAAPTGVSAVSASATSNKISWTSVSGASGYQVYRSTSLNGTYTWVANAWTNNYTNTGLTTGTTYYYKVKAYKIVGTTSFFGNDSSSVYIKTGN